MAQSTKTPQDYFDEIKPLIHTSAEGAIELPDVIDSLNRGVRELRRDHGIHVTGNDAVLDVFPNIYRYPLPTDFSSIKNIHTPGDSRNIGLLASDEFWRTVEHKDNIMAIDNVLGQNYLLLKIASAGSSVRLHACDDVDTNGTWSADTAASDATNLTQDKVTRKRGSGSLNFDIDVSQSGNNYAAISISDMASVDLSTYENLGTLFLWAFIPDATNITSITARFGSSSSAYWEGTATTRHDGGDFKDGWNQISIAWQNATQTGTVDETAINFLYVRVTYAAAQTDDTDFRIDDIRMESPEPMEIHYYSNYFTKTTGGTLQTTFVNSDDVPLLDEDDEDYLLYHLLADADLIRELGDEYAINVERKDAARRGMLNRLGTSRKLPYKHYYRIR